HFCLLFTFFVSVSRAIRRCPYSLSPSRLKISQTLIRRASSASLIRIRQLQRRLRRASLNLTNFDLHLYTDSMHRLTALKSEMKISLKHQHPPWRFCYCFSPF
ncbi:unnamed protein product, partial [Brassica rapa subsp. trilocularis]